MYKYTLVKDNKTISLTPCIDSIRVGIMNFYLRQSWEIVKIEIDGIVLFEKK